jgi:hypothetical protein
VRIGGVQGDRAAPTEHVVVWVSDDYRQRATRCHAASVSRLRSVDLVRLPRQRWWRCTQSPAQVASEG